MTITMERHLPWFLKVVSYGQSVESSMETDRSEVTVSWVACAPVCADDVVDVLSKYGQFDVVDWREESPYEIMEIELESIEMITREAAVHQYCAQQILVFTPSKMVPMPRGRQCLDGIAEVE